MSSKKRSYASRGYTPRRKKAKVGRGITKKEVLELLGSSRVLESMGANRKILHSYKDVLLQEMDVAPNSEVVIPIEIRADVQNVFYTAEGSALSEREGDQAAIKSIDIDGYYDIGPRVWTEAGTGYISNVNAGDTIHLRFTVVMSKAPGKVEPPPFQHIFGDDNMIYGRQWLSPRNLDHIDEWEVLHDEQKRIKPTLLMWGPGGDASTVRSLPLDVPFHYRHTFDKPLVVQYANALGTPDVPNRGMFVYVQYAGFPQGTQAIQWLMGRVQTRLVFYG